jgi:predicted ATPase
VLVSGEAGVGKTRLTQEIDAEADARGLRVLVGHSTRDEGRALIVGTFRDDEVEPSSPLARILNQLVRQRLVTRISLRPLTEEGVAALVAGLTGQRPPATLVSGIYAQSEGNPFFAEEVYLHPAETGCSSTTRAGSAATCAWRTWMSPPASAWSSGSGWPGCPRPPSGRWSRPPCAAGSSSST